MAQIHPNWETRTRSEPRKSVVPTTKERPGSVSEIYRRLFSSTAFLAKFCA